MAILDFISLGDNPKNQLLINNEIRYILRGNTDNTIGVKHYGGRNFLYSSLQNIIDQFYVVREVYHKNETIQGRHFVLSFSDEYDNINPFQACCIADHISEYFGNEYQVIYAVHNDSDNLHIHFFVNATNIITGKMLNFNKGVMKDLFEYIEYTLQIPSFWYGSRPIRLLPNPMIMN